MPFRNVESVHIDALELKAKIPYHVDGVDMKLDVGEQRMTKRWKNSLEPGSIVLTWQVNDEGILALPSDINDAVLERVFGVVLEDLIVVREMGRCTS